MPSLLRAICAAAVCVLVVPLAACGVARAARAATPTAEPTLLLVAIPTTAPIPTPRPQGPPQAIDGTLSEYSIYLSQTEVGPGSVRFVVTNTGQRKHNLHVLGNGVDAKTRDLGPGQMATLSVTFGEPGPYTVYCDLADHADRGMTLTLAVG